MWSSTVDLVYFPCLKFDGGSVLNQNFSNLNLANMITCDQQITVVNGYCNEE